MVKVRFLESVYIGGKINRSFAFNDEFELDQAFAERLQTVGRVDILKEEKVEDKPKEEKKKAKANRKGDK